MSREIMNSQLPPPLPYERRGSPAWPFFAGAVLLGAVCFVLRLKRLQALHPEGFSAYEQGRITGEVIGLPLVALIICGSVPSLRNRRSIGVGLLCAFGAAFTTALREWLRHR